MDKCGHWPGTWRIICDRCGFEYSSDQVKKEWTGLIVCHPCFEPRHPQDFVRGIPDDPTPPFVRPEPPDEFVTVNYVVPLSCTPLGSTAVAGFAIAGCMIAGRTLESLQV